MNRVFSFINEERAVLFARMSLALMLVWFGAMNFTSVGEGIVTGWLKQTMLISGMANMEFNWAYVVGGFQLIAGLGLAFGKGKMPWIGAMMAIAFSGLALLLMFFANVWNADMGGFPAIGAGQGIIKYVSILGVGMFLAAHFHPDSKSAHCNKMRSASLLVILFGLVLVLGWIGGMKFTTFEAQQIEPLLRTSPFFSWLLDIFDMQGASNFIGVVELLAVALLLGWFFNRTLFQIGAALCVVTFLGTLSFMITFSPTWAGALGGFPALGGAGHFLLKDLVMLAGTLVLVANVRD